MSELLTKHLFTLKIRTAKPVAAGLTPTGKRIAVQILDGTFEGERIKGTVESGGSDWITIRSDSSAELNVRVVLKTDDGELILATYTGRRHMSPETAAKMERGETPDESELYLKIAVVFDTASEKYSWLNQLLAVGTGTRPPEGPIYEVFEVV